MMKQLALILMLLLAAPAWAVKAPIILTRSLPAGQNGSAYSQTLRVKFGTKPYAWTITAGALPDGLALNAATGAITGTPTVNNTFSFTATVTDSEGTPKHDDQGLFITVTGSAPPPPAVKISTTALPAGQVGVAYTTTLQATNGTAPYTWSNPAGNLAPGISLAAATGVVSGTPTASGTYSPTLKVTDSSAIPQTDSKTYAQSVASAGGTTLFSDALTSFAAWDLVWNTTDTTIAACPGGGTCAQIHYVICGDSTNPVCGAAHQDINRAVVKMITLPTHFFMRAYVYFKSPEAGATSGAIIQRKLFRFSDSPSAGGVNSPGYSYQFLLDTWNASGGAYIATINFSIGLGSNGTCGTTGPQQTYFDANMTYDAFHAVEFEVQLNTAGASDGIARVWVDGVQKYTSTTFNYRGTCATPITYFNVGSQSDRNSYAVVDEYRNIKNVVFSTGYIGP